MSSRAALMLGLVGLAAITGGIVWLTQVQPTRADTVPVIASGRSEPAPAPTLVLGQDHELATPERNQPTALVPAGQPAPNDQPPRTRKTIDPLPVAPPSVALTAVVPAVQAPGAPEIDALKLGNLDAIVGGAAAIKGKYTGSSYQERRTRADLLEIALDANSNSNGGQVEADLYQALKEEMMWLRENMGTPPPAPK